MRFIVAEPTNGDEQLVTLSFDQLTDGSVDVVGADHNGDCWQLLNFDTEGKIHMYREIHDDIGFDVDTDGAIILGEEL